MTYKGFDVAVHRVGLCSWSATVTRPDDTRTWHSTPAWTPWGARYDARWVIDRYLSRAAP